MLRPKKKITKRELKHDPVVSAYQRAIVFYDQNKKYISYTFTALILLVIAGFVYANNRRASNDKATIELGKVFQLFDVGQYRQAIDGVPETGIMGLKAIVENYSGESVELARFYLANSYYQLGNYDEALKHFKDFSSRDDLMESSALAGAAACFEAKGDHASAAKYYEKAVDKAPKSPSASEFLNNAAYNYGISGDKGRAVNLYKRIKKEYPNSSHARDVDRYITQFSM